MRKLHYLLFAMLAMFIVSCSSDDNFIGEEIRFGEYTHGLFVLNEGNFNAGNSEISFIDSFYTASSNNIFAAENSNMNLGDTGQSIAFYKDLAFIIVNNSHKVVVVDRHTFEFIGEVVEGIDNPRYMTVIDGKGYVTNWGDPSNDNDDFVAVIDLENLSVIKSISVELGPEKVVSKDNRVFVAHQGAYGVNNKVSVIDAIGNEVTKVIEVGDLPNSLHVVNNDLWVLSGGNPGYEPIDKTDGRLSKIDLGSLEVTKEFDFGEVAPSHLEFDNGKLYYTVSVSDWETYETESNIYALDLDSTELPTESVFFTDRSFYGATIKDGKYFGADAKDYSSNGSVVVYDMESGEQLVELTVGINPSGLFFTE